MYEEFAKYGRDLFVSHLISSHGGNMSVRVGDRILITRRGSMLGNLHPRDIVETGLLRNDSGIVLASTEIGVHRAIYKATSALAVVHAHPPHGIALSLTRDEIIPIDSEGSYLLHRVPVVSAQHTVGSQEVEIIMPEVLKSYKIAVLRGHGSFATGQFLEEAFQWTSSFEASCQIIYLAESLKKETKEYRVGSDKYTQW
jgi:L-fuculose-phosphate aldolase